MNYTTVIFDLDGTLLDTICDLSDSANYALQSFGFPTHSVEAIKSFVGNGVAKLMERAVPEGTEQADIEKVLACFKQHYSEHMRDKTKPYDGILPLLEELNRRNIKTAIVSNKFDAAVKELSKEYFGDQIQIPVGESKTVPKKPNPQGVFEVMRQLGVTKEECLYIGDSDVDMMTAKNARVTSVGVTWGFRSRECLTQSGACHIIDQPHELLELLDRLKS